MKVNKLFPLQLWLTSVVLVSPLLAIIINSLNGSFYFKNSEDLQSILIIIVFGILYSLPVFIISVISYRFLLKKKLSALLVKFLLILICIVGVVITFLILTRDLINGIGYYSIGIIISSLFYRIYRIDKLKNLN